MALGDKNVDSTIPYFNDDVTAKVEVTDNAESLIYSIIVYNNTGADAFVQIFDADADNVTLGTTVPDYVVPVLASDIAGINFGNNGGVRLTSGFTIGSTTTSTGSTTASTDVSITYKTRVD